MKKKTTKVKHIITITKLIFMQITLSKSLFCFMNSNIIIRMVNTIDKEKNIHAITFIDISTKYTTRNKLIKYRITIIIPKIVISQQQFFFFPWISSLSSLKKEFFIIS